MAVAPILLLSCAIVTAPSSAGEISPAQSLRVSYKNVSHATAHTVYFQAVVNGKRGTLIDKGSFAPGVTITHDLVNSHFQRTPIHEKPSSCIVAAAEFGNGQKWVNPSAHL